MDFIQSVIMGFVQGLSEFLPISSSGHLVFASNFYKVIKGIEIVQESNQEIFLDIMLHLGTLIAVLIFFRKEIFAICKALFSGDCKNPDFKTGVYIILGTVITVLIAYPLNEIAGGLVFKPAYVGLLLIITGILLLFSEYWNKNHPDKKDVSTKSAAIIGIAQGLAALPGFSRSGLTMAAGMLSGVGREKAAKYSFLLSIPIILGSSMLYPFIKLDLHELLAYNWTAIIAGTMVSGITGYFCIKYFLKFVSKFSLAVFGYYCILAGIFAFAFFTMY